MTSPAQSIDSTLVPSFLGGDLEQGARGAKRSRTARGRISCRDLADTTEDLRNEISSLNEKLKRCAEINLKLANTCSRLEKTIKALSEHQDKENEKTFNWCKEIYEKFQLVLLEKDKTIHDEGLPESCRSMYS